MKQNVWIHGISGRMGQVLKQELGKKDSLVLTGGSDIKSTDSEIESGVKQSQLLIDFSSAEGNSALYKSLVKAKVQKNLHILVCSTGLTQEQKNQWQNFAKQQDLSVLLAPNTSLGILMLMKSALVVAGLATHSGFDIEIEECHHKQKKDIPSGTSLFLGETLHQALPGSSLVTERKGERKDHEIGITASRGGGVFGEHRIRFLGEFEEFTLSHRAFSRELFAKGALVLGEWLLKQKAGTYTLNDIDVTKMSK